MPANGESACISCKPVVPMDVSLSLLKKEVALYDTAGPPDPKSPCRMHGVLIMKDGVILLITVFPRRMIHKPLRIRFLLED